MPESFLFRIRKFRTKLLCWRFKSLTGVILGLFLPLIRRNIFRFPEHNWGSVEDLLVWMVLDPVPYLLVDMQPDVSANYDSNPVLRSAFSLAVEILAVHIRRGSPVKACCLSLFRRVAMSRG